MSARRRPGSEWEPGLLVGVTLLCGVGGSSGSRDRSRLRFALRTFDRGIAVSLCEEVEALYTNGPYGGGGVVTSARETVGIVSTLVDRGIVTPRVELL